MAEMKQAMDNITSADNIMASEHSAFVNKMTTMSRLDYRTVANRDLVGEPLNEGIFDEATGKVVGPLTSEEIAAMYKELDGLHTAVNKKGSTLTSKVSAANSEHSEVSQKYSPLVSAQTTALTQVKSDLDEQQSSLTRESNIMFSGKLNSISANLGNLEVSFDAEIAADSKK